MIAGDPVNGYMPIVLISLVLFIIGLVGVGLVIKGVQMLFSNRK
jgi:NADH:ubiquinone oxidoreductase subunit K